MQNMITAAPASIELAQAPIPLEWIVAGAPVARLSELGKSRDGTAVLFVWECTPGEFHWHYNEDETVVFHSGEVFIRSDGNDERRLSAGDLAYFRAGSSYIWRVTQTVRKVAVVRRALPDWLALSFKVWDKLCLLTGLSKPAPLSASNGGKAEETSTSS